MQIENSDTKALNFFLKRRYDPIHLLGLLIKDNNGTAYVDKSQLLASPYDKDLFELFLNYFYHWDFS